ncbi:MAG: hypothetical protein IJ737_06905 [Ruminococcus sp.]|nr:hypothetical protein [Ruminococcus sp.]
MKLRKEEISKLEALLATINREDLAGIVVVHYTDVIRNADGIMEAKIRADSMDNNGVLHLDMDRFGVKDLF